MFTTRKPRDTSSVADEPPATKRIVISGDGLLAFALVMLVLSASSVLIACARLIWKLP